MIPFLLGPVNEYRISISEFNRAISNHNPKRDRAHAIVAEVRARRPEMQVKRISFAEKAIVDGLQEKGNQ